MMNVLLIEDNPADTRMIREVLADARNAPVALVCADRLSTALDRLSEGGVDLVLMDLSLPDSKGFDTFTKVHAHAKGLPIILLTGLDDEVLAVRAVREGAQDYMVKGSMTGATLLRALRFAVERHKSVVAEPVERRNSIPGRILGFVGAKGGVGTTTAALNIAALLAGRKKSVIALELRSYGNSFSLQLQHASHRNLSQLLELNAEQITAEELTNCLEILPCAIKVLFAPQKPDQFKEIRPPQAEAIIRCAAQLADYVVIDLPSDPCYINQTAVRNCDLVTVVVERDATCVAAGGLAVQFLQHWGVEERSMAALIVVKDALAAFVAPSEIGSRLSCPILGTVAPAPQLCIAAARAGTPLALLEPDSIAADSLISVVDKLAAPVLITIGA